MAGNDEAALEGEVIEADGRDADALEREAERDAVDAEVVEAADKGVIAADADDDSGALVDLGPAGDEFDDLDAVVHAELADAELVDPNDPDVIRSQRDEYLETLQRIKAEFDNFRKRTEKEYRAKVQQAAAGLAGALLPVLDACDAARAHGAVEVEPVAKSLAEVLEKEGLERIDAVGDTFDPVRHEAVLHEDGDEFEPVVAEVLRAGYAWKGAVLRTAMVKVRG